MPRNLKHSMVDTWLLRTMGGHVAGSSVQGSVPPPVGVLLGSTKVSLDGDLGFIVVVCVKCPDQTHSHKN